MVQVTLGQLAVRFGLELRGDPDAQVSGVETLTGAGPSHVAFLANPRLERELASTRAGVVILAPRLADACPVACLVTGNPHAAFARVAEFFHPPKAHAPGVHPRAVVDASAVVHPTAQVGPLVVVGQRSRIGARAVVGPGCVIGDDVCLDEDVHLVARVTVHHRVLVGARALLHPGSIVGADGFGFAPEDGRWLRVPQVGSVRIGPDVEIGSNTTVDRGAIGDTVLEEGVKLDNQIQIAHNCRVGAHTVIAGCAGIAGRLKRRKHCVR
jgi:UDP-3-O-[3-hydroxymyristoyl] glucosamine N-acyltransferase